jgi:hypothetical protein
VFILRLTYAAAPARARPDNAATASAHIERRPIDLFFRPSPVSLRSPPSPAVRERGYNAFSSKEKLLSRIV